MTEGSKPQKSLKSIVESLTPAKDNEISNFALRLPTHEFIALKVASEVDDTSINQWVREAIQKAIDSRTEALSEVAIIKADAAIVKGYGKDSISINEKIKQMKEDIKVIKNKGKRNSNQMER